MVFTVRCFKCGEKDVRLIMGGRSIIHARCHSCGANLLADVMEFEEEICRGESPASPPPSEPAQESVRESSEAESSVATLEEDTQSLHQS